MRTHPLSVLAASTIVSISLTSSPVNAEQQSQEFLEISIRSANESIHISWDEVPGAIEYVAYEELPRVRSSENPLDPVYRGTEPSLDYQGLNPREVSRIRLLALGKGEKVIARSLIRTNTLGANDPAKEVSWIANNEEVNIFFGEQDEGLSIFDTREKEKSSQRNYSGFVDNEYDGNSNTYLLTSEEKVSPARTLHEDTSVPEAVPLNTVVYVPDFHAPEEATLESEIQEVQKALTTQMMTRTFEWLAFIEDEYIPAPFLCDTYYDNIGDMYFGGDNRGFSKWDGNTHRIAMSARANFMWPEFVGIQDPRFAGWMPPNSTRTPSIGTTNLFEKQENGEMELQQSALAPYEELHITEVLMNETTAEFRMVSNSRNPLCATLGFLDAPAITVSVNAILYTDGSYTYSGFRDAAPNHQAVISTTYIQAYPEPTFSEFMAIRSNPHLTCVHKHTNSGFLNLALPPVPISFDRNEHSDPSTHGDCSTVDP